MGAQGKNFRTTNILFFDGVNSLVASNIAKKEELSHAENARSKIIGTADKREGMSVVGNPIGQTMTHNFGLSFFYNDVVNNSGLYRMGRYGTNNRIWYLNSLTNNWTVLSGTYNTPSHDISTCIARGNLYMANKEMKTMYIEGSDGVTIVDSTIAPTNIESNVYRCPNANLINYYKSRLYVADYKYDGVDYKNTILMSSTPLGMLALVNNDVKPNLVKEIPVTDNKYFLTGEEVEFWRGQGSTAVATGIIESIEETTITLTTPNTVELLAADEIWVKGTRGADKVFRWSDNPASMGVTAKRYDTFELSSSTDNDSEEIKLMTNVGNVMFIATNNNIAIWNNSVLQNLDIGVGCVSRKGHVKYGGRLFFMHYTGVYVTGGDDPIYISAKIDTYIKGANKSGLENCCAGKKGRSVFFCIGDVNKYKVDGALEKVLKDVALEYDTVQENWYVHTNFKFENMVTYISEEDPDLMVGTSKFGNLPIVDILSRGKSTDIKNEAGEMAEIPYRIDTINILLGQHFSNTSYPNKIQVEMERGSGMKCFVSLDFGDWYELIGEANKGLGTFKVSGKDHDILSPARCRNIRISFRHIGRQLCKVVKSSIIYEATPEEEENKENE